MVRKSSVAIIGCGALGSAAAQLLVRAGVGRIRVIDRDFVELSNLQRQILYNEEDVRSGHPKAIVCAEKLGKINSSIEVEPVIDDVLAEVLPGEKASKISELQEKGHLVGMVGDGVNDAPALTQADVGFAIGSGTDVAIESGDIILVRNDLRDIVAAIQLSKRTVKQVMQNLAWGFGYNTILIPLAAFGKLYPMYAGLAMALSSISVTSWSLTLRRYIAPIKRRINEEITSN
ncbi:MAG: hypothetical protein DRO00_03230 [Thermoproteota archaeon]|nr:MAG: hypothetical protein DRO00_03230 [Candidatus Korarchaeota archaeon]